MEYRKLGNTDLELSILGFGGATLGNEYGAIDAAEGERAVHAAIDRGINFFDVAPFYGRTLAEERLGQALQGKRDKVILSTKCCRYDIDSFDFSGPRVLSSIDESLRRLRTDYVDIFIIHDIEYGDRRQIIEETVPAACKVQQSGKARHIGISALPLGILRDVAEAAPIDLVLSYARYNLINRDLDTILRPVAQERGIGLINASPLLLRILTPGGALDWHPAADEIKQAGRRIFELCESHGVSITDVGLRFCLDYPCVTSTLVGIQTRQQLEENLAVLESRSDPRLLAEIEHIAAPVRNRIWPSGRPENQDEGAAADL